MLEKLEMKDSRKTSEGLRKHSFLAVTRVAAHDGREVVCLKRASDVGQDVPLLITLGRHLRTCLALAAWHHFVISRAAADKTLQEMFLNSSSK